MRAAVYSLLTEDDVHRIESSGVANSPRTQLITELAGGSVRLTAKGEQYYQYACEHFGLGASHRGVASQLALFQLDMAILERVAAKADTAVRAALSDGRIPPQQRALARAVLSGDIDAMLDETRNLGRCAEAGRNVVPFPLK